MTWCDLLPYASWEPTLSGLGDFWMNTCYIILNRSRHAYTHRDIIWTSSLCRWLVSLDTYSTAWDLQLYTPKAQSSPRAKAHFQWPLSNFPVVPSSGSRNHLHRGHLVITHSPSQNLQTRAAVSRGNIGIWTLGMMRDLIICRVFKQH